MTTIPDVRDIQRKRFAYLYKLYLAYQKNPLEGETFENLKSQLGLTQEEESSIHFYLSDKGLIKSIVTGEAGITPVGIDQVERALLNLDKPTHYFLPMNVLNIGTMIDSQVQQGTYQSSQVSTRSDIDLALLNNFIDELKNKMDTLPLDKVQKEILAADAASLEAQVKSPKPRTSIIRDLLNSIHETIHPVAEVAKDATVLINLLAPIIASWQHHL